MICNTHTFNTLKAYKYVVTFARYQGKWLLCRHKERKTWENSGGHIEPGETSEQAARRELYEESGALECKLIPLCDYQVEGEAVGGQVFLAEISKLGELPPSEMAEIKLYDEFPPMDTLTYPDITAAILPYAEQIVKC